MKKIAKLTIFILLSAIFFCGIIFTNNNNVYAQAAENNKKVYLGGKPIGIHAISPYFVVTDFVNVVTSEGSFSPAQRAGLEKGDVILSFNGQNPTDIDGIKQIIALNKNIDLVVRRKSEIIKMSIDPINDIRQNHPSIGIMVKNDLSGIGTVTYVRKDGRFGALGHPISDQNGYCDIYQKGKVYECLIFGYNRAKKNQPGELIGQIETNKPLGTFDSNTVSGILGAYYTPPTEGMLVETAPRNEVKPGKASIYTTIDGQIPTLYDIEIIKTTQQDTEKEKSMVIRVTDKELLRKTGGILQGMSGSPILQNGKLVGAVTHVLTADSTMGYGIYIDWMMN